MSQSAIRVEAVSKKFRRGSDPGYARLSELLQSLLLRRRPDELDDPELKTDDEFWALHDVSFEVRTGEVFGIIGRNGAGKSTLLKILSRVTRPTKGQICTRGRVGSLLEVGTGFHPELTGRENVYLNGSILGMSRREIAAKFDEIATFAEVEEFLDTPVKRYSSGMYTRLAFSVAAHLEPEILIIDEVLAVGDAAFQKKCFGKMQEVAHDGRTVLLVSHNMASVRQICSHGVLLEAGRCIEVGEIDAVLNRYQTGTEQGQGTRRFWSNEDAPRNAGICLKSFEVGPVGAESIAVDTPVTFTLEIEFDNRDSHLDCFIRVESETSAVVFYRGTVIRNAGESQPGRFTITAKLPDHQLNEGTYRASVIVFEGQHTRTIEARDVVTFSVLREDQPHWPNQLPGVTAPRLEWDLRKTDQTDN